MFSPRFRPPTVIRPREDILLPGNNRIARPMILKTQITTRSRHFMARSRCRQIVGNDVCEGMESSFKLSIQKQTENCSPAFGCSDSLGRIRRYQTDFGSPALGCTSRNTLRY